MTIEWRTIGGNDIDHEILWSCVLLACAAMGWLLLRTFGVPALVCAFKAATDLPCPTCGMGRGLAALARGDLWAALRWNPLVPLGAFAGGAYAAYAGAVIIGGRRRLRARVGRREAAVLRWTAVLAVLAVWVWLIADGR